MSYAFRIKSRIHEEGYANTLVYIVNAVLFCLKRFLLNTVLDLRYSRRSLNGNEKTHFKDLGANDTYHTDYTVMPLIFKNIRIIPSDVLVDVGCGKGRVINYWLSRKLKNEIIGLELDPEIAQRTSEQFKERNNVRIIAGDAIANIPTDGTIFYFYNPFCWEKVIEFENRLSQLANTKKITVVYYNPKSVQVFNNGRWDIRHIDFNRDMGVRRWGRINKYHNLAIISSKTLT